MVRCPKCRVNMESIDVGGIEVDRCQICKGLWFDAGEVSALRNSKTAALIDTGNPWEGKQLDFIDTYQCPRCNGKMSHSADLYRTHVHFETCEDCDGSFFDAGEFQGLSTRSLFEKFRRMLKKSSE